jgi:hypothetical protein
VNSFRGFAEYHGASLSADIDQCKKHLKEWPSAFGDEGDNHMSSVQEKENIKETVQEHG